MAELNQQQVIEYIKGISVLELSQLVKALESELGVSAAAAMPMAMPGGGGGGAAAAPAGATIQMEDGFSPEVMKRLEQLGYRTQIVSLPGELRVGYGAAVRVEKGRATAGADPRRAGAAGAVP